MVAKHETPAFRRVRVEIDVHPQALVLLGLLDDSLARGPNRRVIALRRSQIHSVQVASHRVESIVASRDPVRVEHHDDFEYEVLPQASSLLAVEICDELEQPVEHVAAWGFAGMHARRQKDTGLFPAEAQWPRRWIAPRLREEAFIGESVGLVRDRFALLRDLVSRTNREQLHRAALQRIVQNLAVEIHVRLILQPLLDLVCELQGVFVAEGVREGKIRRRELGAIEHVVESQVELVFRVEKRRNFVQDSAPATFGRSASRLHAEHWSQPLIIKFQLKGKIKAIVSQLMATMKFKKF